MSNVKELLTERLKKSDQSSKMAALAKQSANGNLTSFTGIFSVTELNESEKKSIEEILLAFAIKKDGLSTDLHQLISITSEVKAINHQAALLHGERIKKAHQILTYYRDGAFTAWMISVYGNRQTPYNFLQYYEFYESLPKKLRLQVEEMPRQAIYALASRQGPFEKKQELIERYNGETKAELLGMIREVFPLSTRDKRRQDPGEVLILNLQKILLTVQQKRISLSKGQSEEICQLLNELHSNLKKNKTTYLGR